MYQQLEYHLFGKEALMVVHGQESEILKDPIMLSGTLNKLNSIDAWLVILLVLYTPTQQLLKCEVSIFNYITKLTCILYVSNIILEVITYPQNIQVKSGSSVLLTCTSSLSSIMTFSWTHNGTVIKQSSSINGNTSKLTISNVRYSDSGNYVCIVKSSGSLPVTSNTATITVYGKLNCMLYCINCCLMITAML